MGRLFWKFFIFFWLAQMLTSLSVGVAIVTLRSEPPAPPPVAQSPGAAVMAQPRPPLGEGVQHRPYRRGILPPPLPLIAGSIFSFIFAALLAWYFSRPIRIMRHALEQVANGKLDTRVGELMGGRKDELADLGADFDLMASRLQALICSQRRLLHDISHELRSPLARLQAATDLMQQQPERAAELVARMGRDTGRIDTLVGELLTLSRLDSGMQVRMNESVDVQEIIEYVAQDASFEADAKQCKVLVDLPEFISVKGNQELLFRALENVVRNAVRHSPAGGNVWIAANAEPDRKWKIVVSDQGPGVAPDEVEKIFEPFFRTEAGKQHSGYGLGLIITRRVIQAHGGSVTAANRPEGGLAVTILLPAAD